MISIECVPEVLSGQEVNGKLTWNFCLWLADPPRLLAPLPSFVQALQKFKFKTIPKSVKMECEATGSPLPEVYWTWVSEFPSHGLVDMHRLLFTSFCVYETFEWHTQQVSKQAWCLNEECCKAKLAHSRVRGDRKGLLHLQVARVSITINGLVWVAYAYLVQAKFFCALISASKTKTSVSGVVKVDQSDIAFGYLKSNITISSDLAILSMTCHAANPYGRLERSLVFRLRSVVTTLPPTERTPTRKHLKSPSPLIHTVTALSRVVSNMCMIVRFTCCEILTNGSWPLEIQFLLNYRVSVYFGFWFLW